jgi:putative hydrolase
VTIPPRRPRFSRFSELDAAAVNVELQVHTDRTDGEGSIEAVLGRAAESGLSAIAFTEHVRRDTPWFPEFAARVREAARRYPELRVLVGCEAKALDAAGSLDASPEILELCDIVLGSVHRFPDGRGGVLDFADFGAEEMAERECELAVGLLRAAPIDVLAHPGGMYQKRHGPYPDPLFRRMMEASLERGVAVEINSSYLVDFDGFLRLCSHIDPRVSIGSDAHRLEEIGRCRDRLRDSGVGAV